MNVTEAVKTRFSCRAFKSDPVPGPVLQDILETASWSPSGSNLQPWFVDVVTGEKLLELKTAVHDRMRETPRGEGTEYAFQAPGINPVYKDRSFACGEKLYSAIGIAREDKKGRVAQFLKNYEFFSAPVGLFFTLERAHDRGQWADLGMFFQTVMLLAKERGLDTCAQQSWCSWHRTIHDILGIPQERMLFSGMALGYRDPDHPINSWRTDRAGLADIATFHD